MEQADNKRNMIIMPQNGMFMLSTDNGENAPIPMDQVLQTYFYGVGTKGVEMIEYQYAELIGPEAMDKIPYKPKIRIYYATDTDKPWQYNEILSVYAGKPIYTDVVIFIDEEELEGKSNCPFEVFQVLVTTFRQFFVDFIEKTKKEFSKTDTEEEKAQESVQVKQESKPKEMNDTESFGFNRNFSRDMHISSIQMVFGIGNSYEVPATKKNQWTERDAFWITHYAGKYDQRFFINSMTPNGEIKVENRWFTLEKPHLYSTMDTVLGEVRMYFTGYGAEFYENLTKQLVEAKKLPEDEYIAKRKEIYMKAYS